MADPDFSLISELMLKSFGFKEVRILAKKLAAMVDLCDGLLSSQPHYEFGLRSIISILRSAGELKKNNQDEDEHYLISQALQTVKFCEMISNDNGHSLQKIFHGKLKNFKVYQKFQNEHSNHIIILSNCFLFLPAW